MRWKWLPWSDRRPLDEEQIRELLEYFHVRLRLRAPYPRDERALDEAEDRMRWGLLARFFGRGLISTGMLADLLGVNRRRAIERLAKEHLPLAAPSRREVREEARLLLGQLGGLIHPVVTTVPTLVVLSRLRRLCLLRDLFGRVVLLPDDHAEVSTWGAPLPDAVTFQRADWIHVVSAAEYAATRSRHRWCTDGEYRALQAARGDGRGLDGLMLAEETAMKRAAAEVGVTAVGLPALALAAGVAKRLDDAEALLAALAAQGYRLPDLHR